MSRESRALAFMYIYAINVFLLLGWLDSMKLILLSSSFCLLFFPILR